MRVRYGALTPWVSVHRPSAGSGSADEYDVAVPSIAYSDSIQPFGTDGPVVALARLMPFPPVISFVTVAAGPGVGTSAALGADDCCVDVEVGGAADFELEPDEHAARARLSTARLTTTRCLIGAVWRASGRSDNAASRCIVRSGR